MELNNINFWTQQAAAVNKQAQKEEKKPEAKPEAEVRDNKPAEKQVAGEDVLAFLAVKGQSVRVNAKKVEDPKVVENRIGGFVSDFEAAYDELSALGLSEEAIEAIFDKM